MGEIYQIGRQVEERLGDAFRTVGFLIHTDVPTVDVSELRELTREQFVERYEDVPFERLPVLDAGKPVGTLSLSEVGCTTPRVGRMIKLSDSWESALELLSEFGENEALVVDEDMSFAGIVYLRRLGGAFSRD